MTNPTALHMKITMSCGQDSVCPGRYGLSGLVRGRIKRHGISENYCVRIDGIFISITKQVTKNWMIEYQLQQASCVVSYDEPNYIAHDNYYGLRTGQCVTGQA